MPIVVGVVFKRAGKVYYFDPDGIDLRTSDKVVVKTSRGMEFGEVVSSPTEVPDAEITAPLKKVLRKASDEDKDQLARNKQKEKDAGKVADEKIAKHGLPMKLIEVEYVFDASKIIFYFTADGRVDFRDLVKDLASVFKTRIELRQIGVRDEAKMVGGLGPCGQRLCCTVFLGDFEPVSIRMAKEQDLPLNPLKISGICGRLMCCLKYEYEAYLDFKKRAPKRGTRVTTEYGTARIVDFNVPKETVIAELESGKRTEMPLAEALSCQCKNKCKPEGCHTGGKHEKQAIEEDNTELVASSVESDGAAGDERADEKAAESGRRQSGEKSGERSRDRGGERSGSGDRRRGGKKPRNRGNGGKRDKAAASGNGGRKAEPDKPDGNKGGAPIPGVKADLASDAVAGIGGNGDSPQIKGLQDIEDEK